jgi:hypothetical protein
MVLQARSVPWSLIQFRNHFSETVGLLGRVINSSQGRYLNTGQHKHRNKHTHTPNIHALSGIRTHDPSVRASEDSSCLRPRGYCDWLLMRFTPWNSEVSKEYVASIFRIKKQSEESTRKIRQEAGISACCLLLLIFFFWFTFRSWKWTWYFSEMSGSVKTTLHYDPEDHNLNRLNWFHVLNNHFVLRYS